VRALVEKAGLDLTRERDGRRNSDETVPMPKRLDDLAADYDRELILGAPSWLASALRQTNEKALAGMTLQRLREDGQQALRNIRRSNFSNDCQTLMEHAFLLATWSV
jgi:hypothetical protein